MSEENLLHLCQCFSCLLCSSFALCFSLGSIKSGIPMNGILQNLVSYWKLKYNEIYVHIYVYMHTSTHMSMLSLLLLLLVQILSTVLIFDTSMAVLWATVHRMEFLSRDNSVGVCKCAPGMWRRLKIEPCPTHSLTARWCGSTRPSCPFVLRKGQLVHNELVQQAYSFFPAAVNMSPYCNCNKVIP